MYPFKHRHMILLLCSVFILSACNPSPNPAPIPLGKTAPLDTPETAATLPTATEQPAPSPTTAVTETPPLPIMESIWTEKVRLSLGVITSAPLYSPDGTRLAVPTSNGVFVYDTQAWGAPLEYHELICGNPCALAFSPGSDMLAVAYADKIWSWSPGEDSPALVVSLDEKAYTTGLSFSASGSLLAAGYWQEASASTSVFQTSDWRQLYNVSGGAPVFSPDEQTFATVTADDSENDFTFLFDTSDGSQLGHWDGKSAAFLPSGDLLVTGQDFARLVGLPGLQTHLTLDGSAAAVSADGNTLALYRSGAVQLHSLADGSLIRTLSLPQEVFMPGVNLLLLSPAGDRLAASAASQPCESCMVSAGPIVILDTADGAEVTNLPAPAREEWLSFSPDGTAFSVSGNEGIKLYDPASGVLNRSLDTFSDYPGELAFSPDGSLLAVGYNVLPGRFALRTWQVATQQEFQPYAPFQGEPLYGDWWKMAFSPDGRVVGLGSTFWETGTGQAHLPLQEALAAVNSNFATSLAFDPNGQALVLGYPNGDIQVWDPQGLSLVKKLPSDQPGDVISLAYSPDGTRLATAYAYTYPDMAQPSPAAQVWQMPEGTPLFRLEENNIFYVVFAPDGQTLATLYALTETYQRDFPNGEIQLWNNQGERLAALPTQSVVRLAFSPDGRMLAAGLSDGRVQLLTLEGELLQELDTAQQGVIAGLAFSPDGSLLAVATGIGVISVYSR